MRLGCRLSSSIQAEDHSSLCTQQLLYVQIDCRRLVCHKHFLQGMCEKKFPLDFQLSRRGNAYLLIGQPAVVQRLVYDGLSCDLVRLCLVG